MSLEAWFSKWKKLEHSGIGNFYENYVFAWHIRNGMRGQEYGGENKE